MAAVDDKFMEPGHRRENIVKSSNAQTETLQGAKSALVESTNIQTNIQETAMIKDITKTPKKLVRDEANMPAPVATPRQIDKLVTDPEFLPGESDRSSRPIANLHKSEHIAIDLSKLESSVNFDQVSKLLHDRRKEADSKLFKFLKYP